MGFGYLIQNPLLMLGDNTQADLWAREHIVTDANKYIMRDFMRICEAVKDGHIEPRHISTKLNLSDLFTMVPLDRLQIVRDNELDAPEDIREFVAKIWVLTLTRATETTSWAW